MRIRSFQTFSRGLKSLLLAHRGLREGRGWDKRTFVAALAIVLSDVIGPMMPPVRRFV